MLSIALHLGLILAASGITWIVPEGRERDPTHVSVVWIGDALFAENADVAAAERHMARIPDRSTAVPRSIPPKMPELRPLDVPEPVPEVPDPEPPKPAEPAPPEPPEPSEAVSPEQPLVTDDSDSVAPDDADAPDTELSADETVAEPARAEDDEPGPAPRDVDWDEERRRAVRDVLEQHEREQNYRTFSLDDLEEKAPPAEPGPERSVFDSPSSPRRLLAPDKARGKAARWLADKCRGITGGVNVLGLFALCAPSNARSDLFASIKPDYLKARPVCTEVEQPAQTPAGGVKKTHNCRLVVDGE